MNRLHSVELIYIQQNFTEIHDWEQKNIYFYNFSNLFSYLNLKKKGFLSVNVSIMKKLKIIDATCFGNKKCVIYNIKNSTN